MSVLEIKIETEVCKWAKSNGWLVAKLQWVNQTGWPDRSFLKNGKIVFIEFKKPGGHASAKQHYWIGRIRAQGFPAIITDNVIEAQAFLRATDSASDALP